MFIVTSTNNCVISSKGLFKHTSMPTNTHKHTHRHTNTDMYIYTHTHTHTIRLAHIFAHVCTQDRHTNTYILTHTGTHSHTQIFYTNI